MVENRSVVALRNQVFAKNLVSNQLSIAELPKLQAQLDFAAALLAAVDAVQNRQDLEGLLSRHG